MIELVLDFETASRCDLKKAGAWRYSEDLSTEVLCLAFSTNPKEIPFVWVPGDDACGFVLRDLAENPEVIFIAHNAGFEKAIWRNIMVPQYGFPDIPDERWHDTMAVCAMKQVPQQLDRVLRVTGLPVEKDMEGSRLTKSLSKPVKKTGLYDRSPGTLARVYQYCQTDIQTEWALHQFIGWHQKGERAVWLLDQKINERGVKLDMEFVTAAQKIVREASKPLAAEFREITGGLEFTQRDKIMSWLHRENVHLDNLQKGTLDELLEGEEDAADEDAGDVGSDTNQLEPLPPHVHRALHIRRLIGSASVKKLGAMQACVGADGRARGLLQYHGAGPGRWAGRLLQPQNFPRGSIEVGEKPPKIDWMVDAIKSGDWEFVEATLGPAVEVVVSSLRHAICAEEGYQLVAGDFAQVEARVLLALAGQHDKTDLLARGEDPYCDMASTIYRRPITKADKPERQIGKNSVLGLGFQMGAAKFMDRYGQGQELDFFQEVVRAYREDWAPKVPKVWYGLEEAALRAVWDKTTAEAYGVTYKHEGPWLTARLPSGRKLYYFDPQPVKKHMPWSTSEAPDIRAAWTYKALKMGRWTSVDAYGGLLTENVVQGSARDLLVHAMFKAEAEGYPLVLTVHDELVAEPLLSRPDADVAIRQIMEDIPEWAREMCAPIAAETWAGERYRK